MLFGPYIVRLYWSIYCQNINWYICYCEKSNFDSLKKNYYFFGKNFQNLFFLNFGFWFITSTQHHSDQKICLKNEFLKFFFEKTWKKQKKSKILEKNFKNFFFLISSYSYKNWFLDFCQNFKTILLTTLFYCTKFGKKCQLISAVCLLFSKK